MGNKQLKDTRTQTRVKFSTNMNIFIQSKKFYTIKFTMSVVLTHVYVQ